MGEKKDLISRAYPQHSSSPIDVVPLRGYNRCPNKEEEKE
jgi:hypothetical protein